MGEREGFRVLRTVSSAQVITTDDAYGATYRFRLWRATVDDMTTLRMGFRSYYAHVLGSLYIWKKNGVLFQSAKGTILNFESLKQDDLWGFLGKKEDQPSGPKRNISSGKVAVLDAYFRYKFPILARTFAKSNVAPELAMLLNGYFHPNVDFTIDAEQRLREIEGVYVCRLDYSEIKVRQAIRAGNREFFRCEALIVRHNKEMNYLAIHKIAVPIKIDYINESIRSSIICNYINHHKDSQSLIYSGVGILNTHRFSTDSILSIACLLRERATYAAYAGEFWFFRKEIEDNNSDVWSLSRDEYFVATSALVLQGKDFQNRYIYLGSNELYGLHVWERMGYNIAFRDIIRDLYESLGTEA